MRPGSGWGTASLLLWCQRWARARITPWTEWAGSGLPSAPRAPPLPVPMHSEEGAHRPRGPRFKPRLCSNQHVTLGMSLKLIPFAQGKEAVGPCRFTSLDAWG